MSDPSIVLSDPAKTPRSKRSQRVKTPTVLQMEAVECGAACLAMVLGHYGRWVPLERLRAECGISRDGSKAGSIVKVAREYGMIAKGLREEPEMLKLLKFPAILFWNFNHFVVLEGYDPHRWYLNDPGIGRRTVSYDELDKSFTGITLIFEPGPDFKTGGRKPSALRGLKTRAIGLRWPILFAVVAGVGLALLGLVIPTFTKIFIDEYLVNQRDNWIRPMLWAMGLTLGLQGGLTWLQQYILLKLEVKLALANSSRFLAHILSLPISFFLQRYAGDIVSRQMSNERVARLLSGQLATNILHIIMALFFVTIMFQYDVLLTVVGIVIAAVNLGVLSAGARSVRDLNTQLLQEQGKLVGVTVSGLQVIETLKSTGGESDFFAKWAGQQAKTVSKEQRLGAVDLAINAVPTLLAHLNAMTVLGLGGLRVIQGHLTIGELVAFQALMVSFTTPINNLVALGAQLQEVHGDLTRLDDVLLHEKDPRLLHEAWWEPAPNTRPKLSGRLELRNIVFGYNRVEEPLIKGFNLVLDPGSRVALVGVSGSGKSTMARLVSGLYAPWSGEVLFDGRPRDSYPREVLANSIAMVDQDILLFEGTVKENITLWDDSLPLSDVVRAADDAVIHDHIAARSSAYESRVEEAGRNFSGGQRQRLEIARALAGNPSILILDEATSALDPLTEKVIDDNIRRRGCTTLIIAHRLSTIRDCDEIIVLERGNVVERGTHEEMCQGDGPYARLIRDAELP